MTYQSKPIQTWDDIPAIPTFTQSHIGSRILPAEDVIQPLAYRGKQSKKFLAIDNDVRISLCYCSIYDQCWLTDREKDPLPIDECEIAKRTAFSNSLKTHPSD
ncbi:hypothetical protein [Shewanella sp. KX20019]|uniref:hypothetical protein n=1 Tax=Shewanella sp. KX20019 TaxID=2803864 RepID=UPI001F2BAD7B|nr:hypothetical protein [Shewanella sp. KX20019]